MKSTTTTKSILAAGVCAGLCSCAGMRGGEPGIPKDPVQVGETMVQTSYDYSRPEGVAPDSKPVWILPVINSGWKPAKVDSKTGDWVGGHYSATVVEDGKWATLEEAELSGKPYILPGETRPIIPTPLRSQGEGKPGEINATTLEQKLARLDRLERESAGRGGREVDSASKRSLINQSAIPAGTDRGDGGAKTPGSGSSFPPAPETDDSAPMTIPGITGNLDGAQGESKSAPLVLGDVPNLPPLKPPPQGLEENAKPIGTLPAGPSPSVQSGKGNPDNLMKPTPSPKYNPDTGEILIGVGQSGSTVTIDTPKGPATIAYGKDGEVSVTIKGKTRSIRLTPPQNQVKIKLSQ